LPADADLHTASGFVFGGSRQDNRWKAVTVSPETGDVATVAELGRDEVPIDWAISPTGTTLYASLRTASAPIGDLGVISLDVATGQRELLIPPAQDVGYQRAVVVLVSVSGRTLAAPRCKVDGPCLLDVLDLHGSGPVVTYGPFFARALDDSHVLGDTEGSGVDVRPWKVLNLATTAIEPIATDEVSRTSDGYALGHGLFLVSGTLDGRTYNIGLVGVASGGEQPLLSQDWGSGSLLLRPYLTSDRWALLSDMSWESGRGGTLRVLDLQTGKVLDRIVNPEP